MTRPETEQLALAMLRRFFDKLEQSRRIRKITVNGTALLIFALVVSYIAIW